MTTTLTVLIVVQAGLFGALLAAMLVSRRGRPSGWLEERVATRLLVHTRDGDTVDGVVTRVHRDGLELESVRWEDRQLGGTAWVPRERIRWVQQPPSQER